MDWKQEYLLKLYKLCPELELHPEPSCQPLDKIVKFHWRNESKFIFLWFDNCDNPECVHIDEIVCNPDRSQKHNVYTVTDFNELNNIIRTFLE